MTSVTNMILQIRKFELEFKQKSKWEQELFAPIEG